MSTAPFDFAQAREASKESQREQVNAEDQLRAANKTFARAEEAYRKALAAEMWSLRRDDNVAWSTLGDLARGADRVAGLKAARDEAEGDRIIAEHAVYRRSADRRDTERFITWSMRRDLAEGFAGAEVHTFDPPIGGQRVA